MKFIAPTFVTLAIILSIITSAARAAPVVSSSTQPASETASIAVQSGSRPAVPEGPVGPPGLPFTEDFSDTALQDPTLTNANWSTTEQVLELAWPEKRFGAFGPGVTASDITADNGNTREVAVGDVDGDGDLDFVAGNQGINRIYLNNGTADPWNGVSGSDITADASNTFSAALGDVDGDGDLDLVVGNYDHQVNRLYLNNGTSDPWNGVSGSDITADGHSTVSLALGDVDGDGDLDLVVGNYQQANRLYLNNGTSDPWNGVSGSDITADNHSTFSVALADVDNDGDLDLVAGNDGNNRLYLNNGTSDPWNGVSGSDITADNQTTRSMALGDVDGDGDLDLVVGNFQQANRLYLNNGTASPWNGVSGSDITADSYSTRSVTLGDVDGDGDLDLISGNSAQPNRLYLNNGTEGPWNGVSSSDITVDNHFTESVALGDVDGDDDLDLVAGNYGQVNRFYLNNGTVNPWNGISGSDITTNCYDLTSVALGDVDGDGDLDFVAGNYEGVVNRLYLNNGSTDPWNGVNGSDIGTDTHYTSSVVLGDVDGDGDLDLVTGNLDVNDGNIRGATNYLFLNNGTSDPWDGVSGREITADSHVTRSMALGDVDGDGDLDLVVGNYQQADRLYLNNGTNDPWNGVSGSNITPDLRNTTSVALGDVDGDGDLDIVVGNRNGQTNRLYLNNGTSDPWNGVSGSDITNDISDTNSIALGDVDGDGDLDLVSGNWNQPNRLYLNNGTDSPWNNVSSTVITTRSYKTQFVVLGDVDVDGDLDLVTGDYGHANQLYLNNGTADPWDGVEGSNITANSYSTTTVAMGDVDSDGDLDLIEGIVFRISQLYLNQVYPSPVVGWAGMDINADAYNTLSVALGDLDGDGDLDVVAGNYRGQTNQLYLNNGTVTPFAGVMGTQISPDVQYTYSVALGDVDGDGDLDLVTGNAGQANRLYLNNGTVNPFVGVTGADISVDMDWTVSVTLGDVDGDGNLDLVAGNYTGANRLYLNNGTTNPFAGVTGVDISTDAYQTYSVALEDADSDGDLDLIVGNQNQRNRLYLNNGTADPFAGVIGADIGTDADWTVSVALGDVDSDGDLDVVAGNSVGVNRLYLNNGTADPFVGVTGVDISADERRTFSVALGDVDGDGDLDLVAGDYGSANRLYLNNGTTSPFAGVTGEDLSADWIGYNTRSVALGYVDGDGDLDVVAGNWSPHNRLYQRLLYDTGHGRATSLRVDTETSNITNATLTAVASLPLGAEGRVPMGNTDVTYFMSNNGGGKWYQVRQGVNFAFPTSGMDLRWRAELRSLSPVRTPLIDEIQIDHVLPAVTLANFGALQVGGQVQVTWETVSELNNAGFNLYRNTTPDPVGTLLAYVPSQGPGSAQGFAYSYDDRDVQVGQTYWYWLEAIDLGGATTLFGPVSVTMQPPTAVRLDALDAHSDSLPESPVWWLIVAAAVALAALVGWRRCSAG